MTYGIFSSFFLVTFFVFFFDCLRDGQSNDSSGVSMSMAEFVDWVGLAAQHAYGKEDLSPVEKVAMNYERSN